MGSPSLRSLKLRANGSVRLALATRLGSQAVFFVAQRRRCFMNNQLLNREEMKETRRSRKPG
jgi:hypothetical protein